jgi:hypothetical protein
MAAIIQVWSAPSCQSGAVCLGALSPWGTATGSESEGTPSSFRTTVSREVADASGLAEGRVLRVRSSARGEQWWFVSQLTDGDGDAGAVAVTAGPLRQLLAVRGLVRSTGAGSPVYRFSPGKQTVTSLLNSYVLTNLSDDSLSWLSLGTVDSTALIEVGDLDRVTRGGVLDLIERETGHSARLRGLYSAGVLTGFAVDVVADVAAGLETLPLGVGANVEALTRTRDALRAATVALPFSASGQPMDQCEWTIDSVSGSGPYWVLLRDPVAGNPWPIREDDQVNGYKLVQRDGTQTTVADSRASDSAVQVSALGTLAAGQRVTLVTSGGVVAPQSVTSPSGLASSRAQLVGTVGTKATDARRNYAANPVMATWTNLTTAPDWTHNSGTGGFGVQYQRYARNTPLTLTANVAEELTAGVVYSDFDFSGAPPHAIIYQYEILALKTGGTYRGTLIVTQTVQADSSGNGNLQVQAFGTTPTITLGNGTIELLDGNAGFTSFVQRPDAFPDDSSDQGDAMRLGLGWNDRLLTGGGFIAATERRLENTEVKVLYDAARPYLHARAAFTVREYGNNTLVDSGGYNRTPAVAIVDPTGTYGTLLALGLSNVSIPARATANCEATCATKLTADKTVKLAVYSAKASIASGSDGNGMTYLRWASLWLSATEQDSDPMDFQPGSGSNTLWHRAQDVLAGAALGTRYVVRGIDLDYLQRQVGTLVLGQRVALRSDRLGINAVVRVVKMDYRFDSAETLDVELGAITPRLTGVTVSL